MLLKNKSGVGVLISLFLVLVFSGCQSNHQKSEVYTEVNQSADRWNGTIKAKSVPQWEEMLFQKSGWIGADGVYVVPLNGVERHGEADQTQTMFWFSDSIIGNIEGDSLQTDWEMVHNSVGYMEGAVPDPSKITFSWRTGNNGEALSMFEPNTPGTTEDEYYWLGDGFFNHAMDSTIYIFAYKIKNVPGGVYPFDDVGVSLISLPKGSKPPFENQKQMDTPFFKKDSKGKGKVVFGISVMANTSGAGAPDPDGYIYIYGVRGPMKELIVARVQDREFESFDKWRFWDGATWSDDMDDASALTNRVSNEMSVSFMEDGRVMAVYQLDTNSPNVAIQVGRTPTGPFQPHKIIYETPEIYEDIDFYTYNAKAHPHLSKPGELLISYNVNSFDFLTDIHKHPHHLRPRFVSFKYQ
ncbi:DUF4185 domain-containing protein [Pararhodonellum marinum]|uniref:DUF4185 domain-containing protein n=1 Tax=Pararhodonellum marinum TaxID=2755358 RepID=UPI00188EDED8|nr:DUF4185 domain-containing protein [Pararhodonellum marinum]